MNVRTFDVVAQMLIGGKAEMRQHAILSPGQLIELARGECGEIQALQVGADMQTLYLACDNGLLAIRLPDKLAIAALRALMGSTIQLEEVRELERTRFGLDPATGKPTRIATEPR